MAKENIHTVDPESLHTKGFEGDTKVGSKWVEKNVKPVMATEADRKTGQISAEASKSLQNAGTSATM